MSCANSTEGLGDKKNEAFAAPPVSPGDCKRGQVCKAQAWPRFLMSVTLPSAAGLFGLVRVFMKGHLSNGGDGVQRLAGFWV